MKIFSALVLLVLLSGCEYLPVSGGKLEGTVAPAPDDWTAVAAQDIIQLESNPAEPYSVNLWIIGNDADLYVHAGANLAQWVEHIDQDPNVRVLMSGNIYELRAERVNSQEEFDAFGDMWEAKYGNQPRDGNVTEAYLFRLLPR